MICVSVIIMKSVTLFSNDIDAIRLHLGETPTKELCDATQNVMGKKGSEITDHSKRQSIFLYDSIPSARLKLCL